LGCIFAAYHGCDVRGSLPLSSLCVGLIDGNRDSGRESAPTAAITFLMVLIAFRPLGSDHAWRRAVSRMFIPRADVLLLKIGTPPSLTLERGQNVLG
jgi:hypothetical protein